MNKTCDTTGQNAENDVTHYEDQCTEPIPSVDETKRVLEFLLRRFS